MLSPVIKWDHHSSWFTPYWKKKDYFGELVTVNISNQDYKFLQGHNIDGSVLMPAAGYLELVWQVFSYVVAKEKRSLPFVIKNVKFKKFVVLPQNADVNLLINITKSSGYFEIFDGECLAVTGTIFRPADIKNEFFNPEETVVQSEDYICLQKEDFYKIFRLRRCMYKDFFQGVKECDVFGYTGKIEWKENFTSFLDNMIQLSLLKARAKEILLPSSLEKLVFNPIEHLSNISEGEDVEVFYNQDLNIIKSGGVEIIGLEFSRTPSRQIHEDIILETFEFLPYLTSERIDFEDALYFALQIIFQNCCSFITSLKIHETPEIDVALANQIREMLSRQVIANPIYIQHHQAQKNEQCDVAVATDISLKQCTMENTLQYLKPEGFVLFVGELAEIEHFNLQVVYKACCDKTSVYLLRQNYQISESYSTINISNSNLDWLEEIKMIMKHKKPAVAYLYSQDDPTSGLMGLAKCLRAELTETTFISTMIMDRDAKAFSVDDEFYRRQLTKSLCINVLQNGQWGTYVHRPLKGLGKHEANDACIAVSTPGNLLSLNWIERPSMSVKLDPDSQLISVFYFAVNPRDVSIALGNLHSQDPSEPTVTEIGIGAGYAGVTRSGERIMGLLAEEGLSLQVQTVPVFSWQVPRSWSLEDATTVPYAYALCYYAMIMRGHMQSGESILIHTGSGGIRSAAISVALGIGCTAFISVTNQEQCDHINKLYPRLNKECIGNLRSTSFRKLMQNATKGKGVNVILNSFAADSFQESWGCIAKTGRFLEIGETESVYDITVNSKVFERGCSFLRVTLRDLLKESLENKQKIKYFVKEGINTGIVQPLSRKIFEVTEGARAFKYLSTGKHEENILIRIREEAPDTVHSPTKSMTVVPQLYFDPKKSYVIIGGLGGLGLELTDWLIKKGATKIVLNSRRQVSTGFQSYCFKNWSQIKAVTVKVNTEDTANLEGAENLMVTARELGPVGGVFHLAIVLQDAPIENQTKDMYERVFRSKIVSARNMDTVTRRSCPDLDHFVVFSSITSGRGTYNTSNYGMTNSELEMLCIKRKERNLPALAVQWGPIADVGMWARLTDKADSFNKTIKHILPQNIDSCWKILENFMLQSTTIVASTVLSNKISPSFSVLVERPSETVARIMQFENLDMIDKNATLTRLGMDSIIVAEVRQSLYTKFHLKFSVCEIQNLTFNKLIEMEKKQDTSVVAS